MSGYEALVLVGVMAVFGWVATTLIRALFGPTDAEYRAWVRMYRENAAEDKRFAKETIGAAREALEAEDDQ